MQTIGAPGGPHIFWDVDNICPSSLPSLTQLSLLLTSSVSDLSARPTSEVTLVAFANPRTITRLAGTAVAPSGEQIPNASEFQGALDAVRGNVVCTKSRKQSTDLALRTALCHHAASHPGSMVACVSDDTDFATTLRYCASSLGCYVISIGEHNRRRKRPHWATARRLETLRLARAADATIVLTRPQTVYDQEGGGLQEILDQWGVGEVWINPR